MQQQGQKQDDKAIEVDFKEAIKEIRKKGGMYGLSDYLDEELSEDTTAYQRFRWNLAHFVENSYCRLFCLLMVVLNGVTIGMQLDLKSDVFEPIETFFLAFFTIEVFVKI